MKSFIPKADSSVKIAGTTSSGNVSLGTLDLSHQDILVTNLAANPAFVKFGTDNTVAAGTDNDIPIPGGASRMLNRQQHTYVAAILTTGTGDVWFTPGCGSAL